MTNKNKTVVRSMDILNLFIDHRKLKFQEIIDLSGMPKSSVYRMLKSLEEMGFLEKGMDANYRLGLLFLTFGNLVSTRLDRSEEHTSELQSRGHLVCPLLLEKKKTTSQRQTSS